MCIRDRLSIPFLGEVPLESQLRIGGDQGIPIVISDPDSESAKAIENIAKSIIENNVMV